MEIIDALKASIYSNNPASLGYNASGSSSISSPSTNTGADRYGCYGDKLYLVMREKMMKVKTSSGKKIHLLLGCPDSLESITTVPETLEIEKTMGKAKNQKKKETPPSKTELILQMRYLLIILVRKSIVVVICDGLMADADADANASDSSGGAESGGTGKKDEEEEEVSFASKSKAKVAPPTDIDFTQLGTKEACRFPYLNLIASDTPSKQMQIGYATLLDDVKKKITSLARLQGI